MRELRWSLHFFRRSHVGIVGLGIILFFIVIAIFADFISPYSPVKIDLNQKLLPPSLDHPFGTDTLGMDIFSRIIYGTRISLGMAATIAFTASIIGVSVGVTSGYFGGFLDTGVLMRITDIFLSFPTLILAMAITAALGPGLQNFLIAATIVYWPGFARVVRGSTLSEKEKEYIEAARAVGESNLRIAVKHIIPNVISPVIVLATLEMGFIILLMAALGFIGLGAQPPTPEWGAMISKGRYNIITEWWISTFPGLAIMTLVLGFMLFGDGLRDILDPRLRK